MKVSRTLLANIISHQSLSRGQSKHLSQAVAAYLLSSNRVSELDSLMRDVQADWAEAGYVEVSAASVHPLTAKLKLEIAHRLKPLFPAAKRIIVSQKHDPSVIGRVRLNLANQQLDLSIATELDRFKHLIVSRKDFS